MERSRDLEESIREYRIERLKTKKIYIIEQDLKLKPVFHERLKLLIAEQVQRQREEHQDKVKYLFLCRLMSSGYTGSYEAILGMSSFRLYLDKKQSQTYWNPELIYEGIDQDMKTVREILQAKFIRLEDYELLGLKQELISDDWSLLKESFQRLMDSSFSVIIDSSLLLESELVVLFGNYMDELEIIWHAGTEGREIK